MLSSGIYGIVNLFNDKIYVGSASRIKDRFSWHYRALEIYKHHNILLQRAWVKYGSESFIFFVIERTDNINLLEREQYWLERFSSHSYNLYFKAGSPAGSKHTEEAKIKISIGGKGRKLSEETKRKMSEAQKNRSDEHRANHSAGMRKRVFTPEHRQKLVEANARIKARKLLTKKLKDV